MITEALRSFKSKIHAALNSSDRRAKIQDSDFIIGLLQAVAKAKSNFTLSELHQSMCMFLEIKIGRSAFNERIGTASLVKGLQLALTVLMTEIVGKNRATTDLHKKIGVSEITGIDASMVSLWDGLCEHFKGTFMHAAVKLHLSIDLVSGAVKWFSITAGATHDSRCFPILSSRSLYIFDLGYWSSKLLQQISREGAFFLSRLKSNATLTVRDVIYGMGLSIVGRDLLDFPFQRKRKSIVELIASMSINGVDVPYRVLGFWNKKDRSYRWYITNLKCARHLIYDLYRLRWQLELSFKSMKSTLNFDRMPTLGLNAILAFTLVALINYVFTTIIREEARIQDIEQKHSSSTSTLRAAKVYSAGADAILDLIRLGWRLTTQAIARLIKKLLPLLSEVFDPNCNKRKTSLGALLNA
ncbi:MAG: IS4 family transposase [Oligoflexia bacterium]|nr:IS4 family transposase [Oligoflexia bacterium]